MFGDGVVRVYLNWDRLDEPGISIRQCCSRSSDELGDLLTVWYSDSGGHAVEWDDEGALPMSVRDVASQEGVWSTDAFAKLTEIEAGYRRLGLPVVLFLPVYVVGRRRVLIDGTHRAIAAFRSGLPVRVSYVEIHGPVERDMLPDLCHYAGCS